MRTKKSKTRAPRNSILAALAVAALLSTGCPGFEAPWASQERESDPSSSSLAADTLAAETEALERKQAEAAAAEAAALEAAEKALAEREELLRVREQQLAKQEALRQEQARIAERKAEAEARERRLAAKEKELENYEANLAFQEEELRDRETLIDETLEAMEETDSMADGSEPGDSELFPVDDSTGAPAAVSAEPTAVIDDTQPVYASLEPGRLLEVEFDETVSTATHRLGDEFSGRLVQDLTAEDGTLVVPAGSKVIGRVTQVTPLKKVGGRASLEVEFTHLVLPSNDTIAVSASFVELGVDKRKDKKKIAGAAIVGAILGRVLGGDGAEGVLAGAAAGAAAGTIAVSRGEGRDAEIPKGQVVALQLEEVVTVEVEMTGAVRP